MSRESSLNSKIAFITISILLFIVVTILNNPNRLNVRGNWSPVIIIFLATMGYILFRNEEPEDHYKGPAGKYSTPEAINDWHELQNERRKTHEHTVKPPKIESEPRLSVPLMFLALPAIISVLFLVFFPGIEPIVTVPFSFSLILLFLGLRSYVKKRNIDDTPTLKTMGAFIGHAELAGTAETEKPLTSFVTGTKCVWYSWSVDEQFTDSSWNPVPHGGESSIFYLKDDTGFVRVNPENALMITDKTHGLSRTHYQSDPLFESNGLLGGDTQINDRRRFTESLIPLHAPIYVIGNAREREDIVAAEIAYDENTPLYVISTQGEKAVSTEYRNRFLLLAVIGFTITLVFPWSLMASIRDTVSFCVLYVATIILGWSLVVYNSLMSLRNDVDQAWSLIDIQLNRRSDLIPNLVKVILGYREYEEYIQVQIEELRKQAVTSEMPKGVASMINSLAEAYPMLKAGNMFFELQRSLEETEQRIALAREYYNQLAVFYNTRLEIVPDKFVASLGGLKRRQYWDAENFILTQENINFAS